MLDISPSAVAEILAAAIRSDAAGLPLGVAARALPDGSIGYGMGFDDEREHDESIVFDGLVVLVGAKSQALLARAQLDYVEIEPGRFDFVFMQADVAAATTPAPGGCGGGGCSHCGG
jgi:iron-sulfur cluster assembly protein